MQTPWMIHAALQSGMGNRRKNNEDAYYFNGVFPSLREINQETVRACDVTGTHTLWAVCDGIGGINHGELASQCAVSRLDTLRNQLQNRDFTITLQDWMAKTDREILRCAEGGGCTIVLLYFDERTAHFAHVGDSRIYRFHQSDLTQLTRDHTKVEMMVSAGLLRPEQVATHPDRHVITRSLGASSEVICTASIGQPIAIANGDRYLLCSDGITDMLTHEDIRRISLQAETPADCASALYQCALHQGGRDNLTILVVDIEVSQPDEADWAEGAFDDELEQTAPFEHIRGEDKVQRNKGSETVKLSFSSKIETDNTLLKTNFMIAYKL